MKTGTSLTDAEIIKALECCGKNPPACHECKYKGKCNRIDCYDYLKRDAFDLINRQQAEIERLKKQGLTYKFSDEQIKEIHRRCLENVEYNIKAIKSEAYKECIEKVRELGKGVHPCSDELRIFDSDLDNLLKEMG